MPPPPISHPISHQINTLAGPIIPTPATTSGTPVALYLKRKDNAPDWEVSEVNAVLEKVKFSATEAAIVLLYVVPQLGGFYLFSRLYGA